MIQYKRRKRIKHHAALRFEEVGGFLKDLRGQDGIAARALEFTILNAARTGEVIRMKWAEVDLSGAVWTVPAERIKGAREHRVPLSPAGPVQLLRDLPQEPGYVFPGRKPGTPLSNMAMLQLLERMGRGDLIVHGFRSTFRDWAAEQTSFPREVCEMALAHAIEDETEAAYRRGDLFEKRRRLMEAWGAFTAKPGAISGQTVTAINSRAA